MDLKRQRRRAALFFPTCTEREWLAAWPRRVEGYVDEEVQAIGSSDRTVGFVERPVEAARGRAPEAPSEVDKFRLFSDVKDLYARSERAQYFEAERPKRDRRQPLKGIATVLPEGLPQTVLKRAAKGDKWVASDPAWPSIEGRARHPWIAEHSLRLQVALRAWRLLMGDRITGPLPCRLDAYGETWVAAHMGGFDLEDSWAPPIAWPVCGQGATPKEALLDLCKALGATLDARPPVVWGAKRE